MKAERLGVLVIGPSGSGKSTFVAQLSALYSKTGRKHSLVNLDPGNETVGYLPEINITELITIDEIQRELSLGYAKKTERRPSIRNGLS